MVRRIVAVLVVCGAACGVSGQAPGLALRFSNGTNQIVAAPGAVLPVQLWVVNLPPVGTQIPWTSPPGTGQVGTYEGFRSVLLDIQGSGCTWHTPTEASIQPPFTGNWNNPGVASGPNVLGISVGVAFGPPVTASAALLWIGSLIVGAGNVELATATRPVSLPPLTGLEIALGGIMPLPVSHYLPAVEGTAHVTVPAPGGVALLVLAGVVGARRRRWMK